MHKEEMMPKIEFRYSWVYDDHYRSSPKIQRALKEKSKTYPSQQKIERYIEKIKPLWRKVERKTFEEISKIYGLKWNEQHIRCYIIGYGRPFSDPLTMKLFENKTDFIDTLTHELMHQIQIQNFERTKKWRQFMQTKYKNESRITKNHILLHAVHWQVYLNLYNQSRLERNIKYDEDHQDYKRAWEIVKEESPEKIIKEFRRLKK